MKTKRILTVVISLIVLISLFIGTHANVRAEGAPGDSVSFAAFGKQEILLNGPVDSTGIDFYLPADWKLASGSVVHLNLRAYVGDSGQGQTTASAAGYLDLYMNSTWLQTVELGQSNDYSVDVNVPDTAWNAADTRLPQTLRIDLHDAVRCSLVWASAGNGTWKSINVAVSPTSYLYLPHTTTSLPTDLRQLPYPLYQQSFQPDKALVIVPEFPTESELRAALIVEAALARMTDGGLATTLTNAGALSGDSLAGTHAVFVGRPAAFAQLTDLALPLKASGNTFEGQQVLPGDGVLQLVPSAVDPTKAWLIVSGNDDTGIVKAAQAVGSGQVRPFETANLAIVTSVQPQPGQASTSTDITLANLGHGEEKASSYGLVYFGYYFDVPPTQAVTDGAYFQLTYNNSALLNFEESGLSVLLNDQLVGSVRFNDRTTDASTTKFNIAASMFHAGKNLLLLEANLAGATPCIPADEIWVSIKPESLLHLPSLPVADALAANYHLASYPDAVFPSLDNLAFVVSRDNPVSWEIAGSIAYEIGKNTTGTVLQPSVAYADTIPQGLLEANSQIIVGRPSALPVIRDLAGSMPAPFAAGTDVASETNSEFTFKVPESTPVGYLEILPSPWDGKRVILTVLGNSDEGLQSAGQALADSTVRSQMIGNLGITYGKQVIVDDVELARPAAGPTVLLQPTPAAAGAAQAGPFKLDLMTIGIGALILIAILALVVLLVKPKNTKPTQ